MVLLARVAKIANRILAAPTVAEMEITLRNA